MKKGENEDNSIECDDARCHIHGNLSLRGRLFEGVVISDASTNTVTVENTNIKKIKKYNRYMKTRTKLHAHNPPCIGAKVGDRVRISECRKLSKTKNYVVIEKW